MSARALSRLGVTAFVCALPAVATAQVIGSFSWQTQPYCNVITVTIVQQGGLFQLNGADSNCGAGTTPVTGTAVPAGASVVLGMTASLPSGRAAHLSASINLGTLSGTWSDADGNTGPFAFGASGGGSPRPAPSTAVAITTAQLSPAIYSGTGVATTVARGDHQHDTRYYPRGEADAVFSPETITTPGLSSGFSYVAEGPTLLAETFTTTRSGRLFLSKMISATTPCTGGSDGRVVFLRINGVAVRTSALFLRTGALGAVRLVGATDGIVNAGAHTIDVAVECFGAAVPSGIVVENITNTAIVVLR